MRLVILISLAACLAAVSCVAKSDPVMVTCGSLIKLEHTKTGHYLHSHEVAYGAGRGSGQQSVTGYPEKDSGSSLWIVRGSRERCAQGTPIENGSVIKLQHAATRKWLHSHQFYSPLSNQQEVSCFGSDQDTDTGDEWEVQWDDKAKHWERDAPVRLLHKDTNAFLANHNVEYQRPIPGHTEVHALKSKGGTTTWKAGEANAARNELLTCIAKDDPSTSARISQLIDILVSPENRRSPFKEQLLGGGPWQVVYTRGAFLWQIYTSPGKLITGSSNKAAQDFNPSTRAVLNSGEIFGPSIRVFAMGNYTPTNSSTEFPKEVDVTISGGEINAWGKRVPLPIKGSGKFFIEYVDDTIRVFRSTGGGLTVQIRQDKLEKLRGK